MPLSQMCGHERNNRALLSCGVWWASIVYSYYSYCNYYGCYFIEGHRTVKQLSPEHIMHHWEPILQLHSLEIIFHFVWDISWISDYYISFPWGNFQNCCYRQVLCMLPRNRAELLFALHFIMWPCYHSHDF